MSDEPRAVIPYRPADGLARSPVHMLAHWGRKLRPSEPIHLLLALFLLVFFGVLLIWPIVQVVKSGFFRPGSGFTLDFVKLIFADPSLVQGLVNATLIALGVTLLTSMVAVPLAMLSVRFEFPGRSILGGLLLAPLVLPPFVGAIGMKMVLSRFGPLTQLCGGGGPLGIDWMGKFRISGIVVIEALHLYPILLLNVQAALANIDPSLEQAARNLGASRWTVFRRVTLPLIRPGLFAGCTLVMIWSFTELGTPLVFDFYTITPVQVFKQILEVSSNPLPFALVVVMLAASTLLYVVGKVVLGRPVDAATSKAMIAGSVHRLRGYRGWLATAAFAGVLVLALVPHLSVVLTSVTTTGSWYRTILPAHLTLDHFRAALGDELAFPSVKRSAEYAAMATGLAVIVGLAAAIVIVRSNLPGKGAIDALAMLPLATPGIVLSFGYLAMSIDLQKRLGARMPWFLNVQEWPVLVLVLAYAARRMPYVVRAAVAGLQQTPRDLELAAANLGASRWRVLRRITMPLILANLIAGGLLAFAFAMLEVSDSLILAQRSDYYPITKAILELSMRLGDGMYIACALGVWAMVLLILTILSANGMLGRRIGAAFRL